MELIETFFRWDRNVLYSVPPLLTFGICLLLASLTIRAGRHDRKHQLFTLFCLLTALGALNELSATLLASLETIVSIHRFSDSLFQFVIPVGVHFIHTALGIQTRKWLERALYAFSLLWFFVPYSEFYYSGSGQDSAYRWVLEKGSVFVVVVAVGLFVIIYGAAILYHGILVQKEREKRTEILFLFFGFFLSGFFSLLGGLLPVMGIEVYPLSRFAFLPMLLMAYGIGRHQFFDIKQSWLKATFSWIRHATQGIFVKAPTPSNPYVKKRVIGNLSKMVVSMGYVLMIPIVIWAIRGLSAEEIWNGLIPYGIPPLLSFLTCAFLFSLVVKLGDNSKESVLFSLILMVYAFWNLQIILNGIVPNESISRLINHWHFVPLVFLSPLILHLIYVITQQQKRWWIVKSGYGFSILALPLTQTTVFIEGTYSYYWGYYVDDGIGLEILYIVTFGAIVYSIILLLGALKNQEESFKKLRMRFYLYGFWGSAALGLGSIPASMGYELYPLGNFSFLTLSLFAFGMFQQNVKEVLQITRTWLFWAIVFFISWRIAAGLKAFYPTDLPTVVYLFGMILVIASYRFIHLMANPFLDLFFEPQEKGLNRRLNVLLGALSNTQSIGALYSAIEKMSFADFKVVRFSMLLHHRENDFWKGWKSENGVAPLQIGTSHPLLTLLSYEKRWVTGAQIEEWLLKYKIDLPADDIFRQTLLIQPVFFEKKLICLLLLGPKSNGGVYSRAEKNFFRQLGLSLGPVIENAHLVAGLEAMVEKRTQKLEQTHKRLRQVYEISQKVSTHLDLKKASQVFIEETVQTIRPNGAGSILLYHPDDNTLRIYASFGLDIDRIKGFKLPVTPEAMYNYDCFTEKITRLIDHGDLASFQRKELLKVHNGRSVIQHLSVPLISKSVSIGLVNLAHFDPLLLFTEADQHLLENITLSLGHHFENAGLAEETQKALKVAQAKEQEIAHINQVVRTVNATLNLNAVLQTVMEVLQEIFQFDQMGIFLLDKNKNELVLDRYYGGNNTEENLAKVRQLRLPLKKSVSYVCKTFLDNAPVHLPQIEAEMVSHFPSVDQQLYKINPAKGLLIYPLNVQGTAIGTLLVANTHNPFNLTGADSEKIQRYVTQIATAINNAHLYNELKTTQFQLSESKKVAAMTHTFEKFVPKQFLNRIAGEGIENIGLGDAQADFITILFSDLRSFTTLSELLTPQELLNFLNGYLERMNAPIHEHNGFIDKFIGDAIMALFDHPDGTKSEAATCAVKAAIGMQMAQQNYNLQLQREGNAPVLTGIGIHSGPAIIGTVGSSDRMDSTVLGNSVNLASRLEGLTKYYGASILISHETLGLLESPEQFQYRELDWVRVKGKSEPLRIYEVFDFESEAICEKKTKAGLLIQQGLHLRHARRWDEAIAIFHKALDIYPEGQAPKYHTQMCQDLKNNPPQEKNWDGSITFLNK